jgi:hypothetical protein
MPDIQRWAGALWAHRQHEPLGIAQPLGEHVRARDRRIAPRCANRRAGGPWGFDAALFGAEVLVVAVDRGESAGEVGRQQQVALDDAQVGAQRAHTRGRRLDRPPGANLARANVGDRLERMDVVAAAQQGEDAARVLARGRQSRRGALSREDGGHRDEGAVGDRRRVAIPGGRRGEAAEVGIARGVDLPARVHQGDRRQLVEDDQDDRRVRPHGRAGHGRLAP